MMLDKKKQLVEELISHLEKAQGDEFKSMIDATKEPPIDLSQGKDKPKGISIEKIDILKPKDSILNGEPEAGETKEHEAAESPEFEAGEHAEESESMSDEDLAEMLKEYLKKS